ncbi:MAG TPA: ATP-binding protein [Anaerolineales bacterium]|jgi:PAS domain S-box-containing protein|nr:ATP-binding protein [Anaerolineales bacterium]
MNFVDSLLDPIGYFDMPRGAMGWIVWVAFFGFNLWLGFRWLKYQHKQNRVRQAILVSFLILTPLAALFIGLRIPPGDALPMPGKTALPSGAALMFFSAIPWILAAGLLGPTWSGFLAFVSGLMITYYDSHNIFVPLIYLLAGLLFGWFMRQNFRTLTYRLLRIPFVAGIVLVILFPTLLLFSAMLVAGDDLTVRLDYALSILPGYTLAFVGQLLMGLIFAQVVSMVASELWHGKKEELPSPTEASLESGLIYRLVPLVGAFALLMLLGIGFSTVSTNVQRLAGQMRNVAISSASSIPFSLETGQNIIGQLAEDERLFATDDPDQLRELLVEYLYRVPFFTQFIYLDQDQELIAGYPGDDLDHLFVSIEEREAIELALRGIGFQSYSLMPETGDRAARMVFIMSVQTPSGQTRVILGRTVLDQNPFFIPVLDNLETLTEIGGVGVLVDETGMVLYHPESDLVGTYYNVETFVGLREPIYDNQYISPSGIREILYVKPVPGRSWAVVTSVPVAEAQQLALEMTLPLFLMLMLLMLVMYGGLRLAVRSVTRSISALADESQLVSAGDLDHSLRTERVDEVGQLANVLDTMRVNLKSRMDEINRLLMVSEGVASALEMEGTAQPILKGALSTGASAARLVLSESAIPEYDSDMQRHFGYGPSAGTYKNLDNQILSLTEHQPEVVLTNPARVRLQNLNKPLPQAVLAVALVHENTQYGALWIAYDQPHKFTMEERHFLSAVGSQAALAASNARLYLSAQLGRERMEAILESTQEPLLVTDHLDRLLLVNPAGQRLLGKEQEDLVGQPVSRIIKQDVLRKLLTSDEKDGGSTPVEVNFGSQIYFATASPVLMEGKKMGRVCLLRDITHYKELDAMKSEFVDTVNHDLRSPLTTMRGYATMLEMVGDLNEQQARYVEKIVQGVEKMSRLVNTLLDLGRIEAGVGLKLEKLAISDVVGQVAEALRMEAVQKQIKFHVHLPEITFPAIEGDHALLERAIQNLIENAIKYTDPGGEVAINLKMEQDQIVSVEVRDTGVGISSVDMPRLFERFYRGASRTSLKERGSGLGLAIVRSIAERHHGEVTAKSQLGKGSVFTFRIPIQQPKS